MPKVPHNSHHHHSSDPLGGNSTSGHPNVLKRNQACHQCRRRKLKCDARRPCSTCVRSHAHAVAHAHAGTEIPAYPECTFDDVAENNATVNDGPKNRYERLENRINELEALLLQKERSSEPAFNSQSGRPVSNPSGSHLSMTTSDNLSSRAYLGELPTASSSRDSRSFATIPSSSSSPSNLPPQHQRQNGVNTTIPVARNLAESRTISSPANIYEPSPSMAAVSTASPPYGLDVMWPNWPANLPNSDLLRHLVEVFFIFHPHASHLFHVPTFVTTLSLPPSHPKFPATPVLHAICAMGSLYTAAVTSPPLPNFAEVEPDEIFPERYRIKEDRPDSFAEQQAKYAKDTADHLETLGEDLFQVLQTRIILSWFNWSHSRWVEVFIGSAHSLRLAVPLGLNMCPPFHSITKSVRPASIVPPARTIIEDETRRNAFWLAYTTERQYGFGNGWALSLDDQDISQLLPVRKDQFEQGTLVSPPERQWAHSKDLLLVHPEQQTDSFLLYLKGTIMISRVKAFNLRFRARHFAGDISVSSPQGVFRDSANATDAIDPRGSQAFIELDHIVSSFRGSFPSHLKNPITENVVDSHLYTACLMPHAATIILHDPHAEVQQSGCISALKILSAARSILDLVYNVCSTSYDITLLDTFCSFCWFLAGRVLVRFLEAALLVSSRDQISTLRNEIDFVQLAMAKLGERIPLAFRLAKMLNDLVVKSCGAVAAIGSVEMATPSPQQATRGPASRHIPAENTPGRVHTNGHDLSSS